MSFIAGTFDKKQGQPSKLWAKAHNSSINIEEMQVEISFKAAKKSSIKEEEGHDGLSIRHFFISSNFLFYKKSLSTERISGVLDLKWARVEIKEMQNSNGETRFELKIIKNLKFSCIYLDSKEELERVEPVLRRKCIFTDFKQKYKTVDIIGSGSYGTVI